MQRLNCSILLHNKETVNIKSKINYLINQSINLFICFVLQNKKYTNIYEKKFSKAQEGSEMTIRSSSQLPPSK